MGRCSVSIIPAAAVRIHPDGVHAATYRSVYISARIVADVHRLMGRYVDVSERVVKDIGMRFHHACITGGDTEFEVVVEPNVLDACVAVRDRPEDEA